MTRKQRIMARLDWVILMSEATRGWRRRYWKAVKWFWELWI